MSVSVRVVRYTTVMLGYDIANYIYHVRFVPGFYAVLDEVVNFVLFKYIINVI